MALSTKPDTQKEQSERPSHNASSRCLPMKHGENLGENFS